MEDARAVTKGVLWFLGVLGTAVLAAGVYASVQLGELQWFLISVVVLIVGAIIVAAFLGSVTLLNLAIVGPILWLRSKISGRVRSKTPENNGT